MTVVSIPDSSQSICDKDFKTTTSWFTFFQDVWKAIRGGLGLSIGGMASIDYASAGSSGAGETNLMSYTVAASQLVNNGDTVDIKAWGTTAANANNKTIRLYFGSQTLVTQGPTALNAASWEIESTISRKTATTQEIIARYIDSAGNIKVLRTAGTQTLTNANIIKITGQGTSNGDVTQTGMRIIITPNN